MLYNFLPIATTGATTALYYKMIGGPNLHVDAVTGAMKQVTPSASDSSPF